MALFMDGVQLCQDYGATKRRRLVTNKFPGVPGTHFVNCGRMKGSVNLGATPWF